MIKNKLRDFATDIAWPVFSLESSWRILDLSPRYGLKQKMLILESESFTPEKPSLLLTAGLHGNEPAGVYFLMELLTNGTLCALKEKFNLVVIPCINVYGFEYDTRENEDGEDLNRGFKDDKTKACKALKSYLLDLGLFFEYALDFHETLPSDDCDATAGEVPPKEFYLYEVCEQKDHRVGENIIREIKKIYKTCELSEIFSDTNKGGLISYPEASKNPVYAEGSSLDMFLMNKKLARSALTIETITTDPMEERLHQNRICLTQVVEKLDDNPNPIKK